MRPTAARLVRILPRSQVPPRARIIAEPIVPETQKTTFMDFLMKRKEEAGASYPANIRLEPPLSKRVFKHVGKDTREELQALLKER